MTIGVTWHIIEYYWMLCPAMQGYYVRSLRRHLELSQKELAKLAKVTTKTVDLLENNQPLPLDDKREILSQLYAKKPATLSRLHLGRNKDINDVINVMLISVREKDCRLFIS